ARQHAALQSGGAARRRRAQRRSAARAGGDRARLRLYRGDRLPAGADPSGGRVTVRLAPQPHPGAGRETPPRRPPARGAAMRWRRAVAAGLAAVVLGGCMVGPDDKRPSVLTTPTYKEAEGWKAASPSDHLPRGRWWTIFGDRDLDALEDQI